MKNLNWNTYPIIRFHEVPEVDIVLIDRRELPPMGGGEASSIATGAAIGNAIFDATGMTPAAGAVHARQGPACIGKVTYFSTFPLFHFSTSSVGRRLRRIQGGPHMQRREFLAGLAAAGATALIPDILKAHRHVHPRLRRLTASTSTITATLRAFIAAIKAHNTGQTALMNWTPAKALEDMDRDGVATSMHVDSEPSVHFGDAAAARALARDCNDYGAKLCRIIRRASACSRRCRCPTSTVR